ncbi:MAG: T9SS type A sorting domain-containing protein [Calditrichaeota bacterium]|nr:T9SS type A sorting domain-containing protein [Calditrichota bacterium]
MKRQSFSCLLYLGLALMFMATLVTPLLSQNGSWIAQPISRDMSGEWLHGCGKTVAAVTCQSAAFIYFFDIRTSRWSTVDFPGTQTFRGLAVAGQVAMAYSDSFLVGFSGITSSWDTLTYRGQPLDPDPWLKERSWGAGEKLAWFVTDSYVYVFDGELGQWQALPYSLSFEYSRGHGQFWSIDDYVGITLANPFDNQYSNIAYSLPAHAFAVLPDGGYVTQDAWRLNHGFVAFREAGDGYQYIGYSAFTNRFETISSNLYRLDPQVDYNPAQVTTRTTFVFSTKQLVSDPDNYVLTSYGFDTRSGDWVQHSWGYHESEWNVGMWRCGGQFAVIPLIHQNQNTNFLLFSGVDQTFSLLMPGLKQGSASCGGTVLAGYDSTRTWFYSVSTGASHSLSHNPATLHSRIFGDHFGLVIKEPADNSSILYLQTFHEQRDRVTEHTLPLNRGSGPNTPYLALFSTYGNNNEVFFYSGILDTHLLIPFTSPVQPNQLHASGMLAYVITTEKFTLYDATLNVTYDIPQTISSSGVASGTSVALIMAGSNTVYTYNTINHLWEMQTIPETPQYVYCGQTVGLIQTPDWQRKMYAYNGYRGALVPLTVEGNWVYAPPRVNGDIALVVRDTLVYAFTPELETAMGSPEPVPVANRMILYPNFPNPFNATTMIRYSLPHREHVVVRIFDIRGRSIITLVDRFQKAGIHTIRWNGVNSSGQSVPSGVYLYQLQTGHGKTARKMVVLK